MRGSRSKDTKPELLVRGLLRELGVGYRLHRKDLPGKPDIAFIGRKKAIFVHGCFWHQHGDPQCRIVRRPDSNNSFWNRKFEANLKRDETNLASLFACGWDVLVLWECELANTDNVKPRLRDFLS
jgi:DNA mismatch endonuclease, patch repair protein